MTRPSNGRPPGLPARPVRKLLQLIVLIITLYIGARFHEFATQLEICARLSVTRPPGVEAFLPISALVSFKYLLLTGSVHRVHPSALVLFLVICTTALVVKKGFCSWVCPIGLLSDLLSRLHFKLFQKRHHLPKWPDLALRGIKYALAGFFIWTIFINMPAAAVEQFIQSPYNRFANIHMLEFFTHISPTAAAVILVLAAMSLAIPHFWCRYICPYGALLGVLGYFSLGKINRNSQTCINCKKCEAVCPGRIQITRHTRIHSPECSACLRCADVCPRQGAIGFSLFPRLSMPPQRIALVLAGLFAAGIITAKLTGYWQNDTSEQAYRRYFISRQLPGKIPGSMNTGKMEAPDPEKVKKMIEMIKRMETSP